MRPWSIPCLAITSAIFLVAPLRGGAPIRSISLDEALDVAFRQNPILRSSTDLLAAAREREDTASSGYLPSLSLDASYARQTGNFVPRPGMIPSGSFDPSKLSPSGETFNLFNFAVTLRQTVYDFGKTGGTNDSAEAGTRVAEQDLRTARLNLWSLVVTRYLSVLSAQEMVGVALRTRDQAFRYASRAKALFESGLRPKIDLLRTEADAQSASAALVMAQDGLALSKAALLSALGITERFDFSVVTPAADLGDEEPRDFEASVATALAVRPEAAQLRARLLAQEGVIRLLRAAYYPALSAQASFSYAGLALPDLVWNWSAGVFLSFPFFSGFSTVHQVREAEAVRSSIQNNLEALDLAVRMEVEQTLRQVADSKVRLIPIGYAVDAAREALKLAEARYEAGTGNQVELLDAQASLANAEANQVRAQHDLAMAWSMLRRALGQLPPRFLDPVQGGRP